ncbi:MAG: hypothetical protein R6V42_09815, partial [Orrella sp.]
MFARFVRQCVSLACTAGLLIPLPAIGQNATDEAAAPPVMSAPRGATALADVSAVSTMDKPVIAARAWVTASTVT